jgi:hypothetical protein
MALSLMWLLKADLVAKMRAMFSTRPVRAVAAPQFYWGAF